MEPTRLSDGSVVFHMPDLTPDDIPGFADLSPEDQKRALGQEGRRLVDIQDYTVPLGKANRVKVLRILWEHTKALGMGYRHDQSMITDERLAQYIHDGKLNVDYCQGRPIKVYERQSAIDLNLYLRDVPGDMDTVALKVIGLILNLPEG